MRVLGYNSDNRRYLMDPDVAATVQNLISEVERGRTVLFTSNQEPPIETVTLNS